MCKTYQVLIQLTDIIMVIINYSNGLSVYALDRIYNYIILKQGHFVIFRIIFNSMAKQWKDV